MKNKFRAWDFENGRMISKFRAWDKSNSEMLKVDCINWYLEEIVCYPEDSFAFSIELEDVALMQSTGLKDKNGVEIFEGDIVAFEDSDGGYEYQDIVINTGIVEYGELGFYFTNRVAVDMDDFYIKDGRCDDVEVIGNIYENKDLIEVE